jgi:hypothetical protein
MHQWQFQFSSSVRDIGFVYVSDNTYFSFRPESEPKTFARESIAGISARQFSR